MLPGLPPITDAAEREKIPGLQAIPRKHLRAFAQSSDTRQFLALQKLQAGTAAGRHVAELVLNTVLGSNGGSVTTTNDNNLAVLGSRDRSIKGRLGAVGELVELEHTGGAV